MDPRHKVVLITGASAGIGAAAAQAFDRAGAMVVLAARNSTQLQQVAAGLHNRPLVAPTDISDPQQVQKLVERALNERGRIDILVNNAGIGLAGPVERLQATDLQKVLAVDLLGPLYAIQAVVPVMRAQGDGQIINVSSVLSLRSLPYLGGYAAAKAALERMSEALRVELQGSGVVVTVLRPGTTRTGFHANRIGTGHEQRRIAPRGVSAEQVAAALVRAARREPRIAYVSLTDRLALLVAILVPGLVDRLLARTFAWKDERGAAGLQNTEYRAKSR